MTFSWIQCLPKSQQDVFLDIDKHPKIYMDRQRNLNGKDNFEKEEHKRNCSMQFQDLYSYSNQHMVLEQLNIQR